MSAIRNDLMPRLHFLLLVTNTCTHTTRQSTAIKYFSLCIVNTPFTVRGFIACDWKRNTTYFAHIDVTSTASVSGSAATAAVIMWVMSVVKAVSSTIDGWYRETMTGSRTAAEPPLLCDCYCQPSLRNTISGVDLRNWNNCQSSWTSWTSRQPTVVRRYCQLVGSYSVVE